MKNEKFKKRWIKDQLGLSSDQYILSNEKQESKQRERKVIFFKKKKKNQDEDVNEKEN